MDPDNYTDSDGETHLSSPESHLAVPGYISSLPHSPTTDTLESVTLDPPPSNGQDDSVETENIECTGNSGGITFEAEPAVEDIILSSPSDHSSDRVLSPCSASEPAQKDDGVTSKPDPLDVFTSVKMDDSISLEQEKPNLSSYFGVPDSVADDFFDSISGETPSAGGDSIAVSDQIAAAQQESQVEPQTEPDSKQQQQPQDFEHTLTQEHQETLVSNTPEVQADKSCNNNSGGIFHQEDMVASSEPETISFEGEILLSTENDGGKSGSQELLDQDEDEFESFTAQGEEVESVPGDQVHSYEPESPLKSADENKPQDSLHPGFHHSLHQTPSVGTTPTQLSPLSTPVHHSQSAPQPGPVSPDVSTFAPPSFDRQSSVPSSPFHQAVPSVFTTLAGDSTSDDPFTASIGASDADRRFDAWIPSDATRHILFTMATSQPGSYLPAQELLSAPVVLHNKPQGDPVRDLVCQYMGEQEAIKRQSLTADSVTQDTRGLQKLVEYGCLRAAVDLTRILLTDVGQGEATSESYTQHTPDTLQLWFCRLSLLTRLKLHELADSEMQAFHALDSPDLYFEFYPSVFPGRRGSMVPFGLRLLHAELPSLLGRSHESLDRLYYVLAVTSKIVLNLENGFAEDGSGVELTSESRKASLELWMKRQTQVLFKIASVLLNIKDYEAALTIYDQLLNKDDINKEALLTGTGRVYLQMGNVIKAEEMFKQVEVTTEKGNSSAVCRNAMNRGLLSLCQNKFSDAYEHFKSAVQCEPRNTCAINNMAVCSLYLGRLKDALNTLESLVHKDPDNNLYEGVLFNLCTLYELESSRALHKKQAVLDSVSRHKGDSFPVVSLKMS
ncbi:trafficking protein particle complex subunit 12-like [Gigantopelta aegis]|uniref:trafficking protein particle complex subunit 12-like n=1 Tax=Gigantopelta aegis TaxID=1735272 RepID=UPI001B88D231|nr:trafficking protein particle complex subunit 12-like [Gigantopelta aegis]